MLPIFSVIVVFTLYNRKDDSEYLFFPVKKHRYMWLIIKISAGLSLLSIMLMGVEKTLFFIPDSWQVYDEDFEAWHYIKPLISFLLGIGLTWFIIDLMGKHKKFCKNRN